MTISRTTLDDGLRNIHEDLIASEEPASAALIGMLTHNQQLIADHLVPRHLINQFFAKDGSSQALAEPDDEGQRIGVWGRFPFIEAFELRVKLYGTKITTTYSADTEMYLFSTPTFPDQDATFDEMLERSSAYWTSDITNTSGRWIDGTLNPEPSAGGLFYLSLWAYPGDDTASEADLGGLCVRERRR